MTATTDFAPRDPAFAEKVRSNFAEQGYMTTLGAEIVLLEPGRCSIAIPYSPTIGQQDGFFHGGAVGGIADSAGGYAAFSLMPAGARVLTVEYKLNLLSPAKGHRLRADGHVMRSGRRLSVARVDVTVEDGENRKLCATLLQTLMCLTDTGSGPDPGAVR